MNIVGMIVFMVIALGLVFGIIYYLSRRFSIFFSTPFRYWLIILSSITVLMWIAGQLSSVLPSFIGQIIGIITPYWMVMLICSVLSVALFDLINLLFKMKPLVRGLLSIGTVIVFLALTTIHAYSIKIKEITIPIDGLTEEIRAVHITDIHLGHFRGERYLDKIVNKINELQPDVVFNTGDMFEDNIYFQANSDVLQPLNKLSAPHYFVYGNHDEYVEVEEVTSRMKKAGVIVLQNEIARFGELQIVGLNNMPKDTLTFDPHAIPGAETVIDVMGRLPIEPNQPTVALHHRPEGVEYMDPQNINLLLSGHTHAGQIFPFTLITKRMFQYNKGLYKYNNMSIYVSEGIGSVFIPLRMGTSAEITLANLVPR